MKITYEFVTGEVSEVEVDERLGGMLLDLESQQYNNDQKETRRHVSLDGMRKSGTGGFRWRLPPGFKGT